MYQNSEQLQAHMNPIENVSNITAVVTVHRRVEKLLVTLDSIKDLPNIREIIITATGFDEPDLINRLPERYRKLINTSPYSNAAWVNGVAHATSPLTVLLHDGDILTPEFGKQSFKEGEVTLYQAFNIDSGYPHMELCTAGFPTDTFDIARMLSMHNSKPISPGCGVFPTDYMLKTLQEFETYADEALIVNDSLLVGNDWYLWWKLTKAALDLRTIPLPLIGFDLADSTTARSDRGDHILERIYNEVRRRLVLTDLSKDSFINMLYRGKGRMKNWKPAKGCRILFDHFNFPLPDPSSNSYGTVAFLTAAEYAYHHGYNYLLYTEDDCRILNDNYDNAMVSDFLSRKGLQTILYGTPILWSPRGMGRYAWRRCQEYMAHTELPITIQGNLYEAPAVYPNGALAIYNTKFLFERYIHPLRQGGTVQSPWDLWLGINLAKEYRENVFDMLLPSKCSYSDNGYTIIPNTQRNQKFYPKVMAWHK